MHDTKGIHKGYQCYEKLNATKESYNLHKKIKITTKKKQFEIKVDM
jgi:hypothetical protein